MTPSRLCRPALLLAVVGLGALAPLSAVGDESGWRKVRDICVPHVEFEDAPAPSRSLPDPEGTVNLDFGLTLGLPAPDYERIKELARGLDYDPEKCYRYVRNNISHASYYGLLKGPVIALWKTKFLVTRDIREWKNGNMSMSSLTVLRL